MPPHWAPRWVPGSPARDRATAGAGGGRWLWTVRQCVARVMPAVTGSPCTCWRSSISRSAPCSPRPGHHHAEPGPAHRGSPDVPAGGRGHHIELLMAVAPTAFGVFVASHIQRIHVADCASDTRRHGRSARPGRDVPVGGVQPGTGAAGPLGRDFGHCGGRAGPAYGAAMRNVPWWGVLSSAAAPVLLVGGSTIAAALQPPSFDPVTDTVSALAAVGAVSRWLMTADVPGRRYLRCDHRTRAQAGRAAGRLILVAGAAVGMLVAAYPQQAGGGGSLAHAIWASAGFAALAVWPAGAWRRGPGVPWGLRPAVCAGAAALLVCLLAWFAAEVVTGAGRAGLAEGVLGVAQAVWPLTVVLSCRQIRGQRGRVLKIREQSQRTGHAEHGDRHVDQEPTPTRTWPAASHRRSGPARYPPRWCPPRCRSRAGVPPGRGTCR